MADVDPDLPQRTPLNRREQARLDALGTSVPADDDSPSETAPIYHKVAHDPDAATQLWFIVCDEGWRHSIVCERMYEWAADWLLEVLGRTAYAKDESRA